MAITQHIEDYPPMNGKTIESTAEEIPAEDAETTHSQGAEGSSLPVARTEGGTTGMLLPTELDADPRVASMQILSQVASDPNADVEKMRSLIDMQKDMDEYEAKKAFNKAMSKFNGLKTVIPHNRKGKTAGSATFTYADYPQLVAHSTPWMNKCGLSHSHHQDAPTVIDGRIISVMVYCVIRHKDGHEDVPHGWLAMPDDRLKGKVSPSQLIQMAITYAKRETFKQALGLSDGDDVALDLDAVTGDTGTSRYQVEQKAPQAKAPAGNGLTEPMLKQIRTRIEANGMDEVEVAGTFGFERLEDVPMSQVNDVLEHVQK
jgi:hypothetical protein